MFLCAFASWREIPLNSSLVHGRIGRLGLLINSGEALLKTGIHRVTDGLKE